MLIPFLAKRVAVMASMAASAAFIIGGLQPALPVGVLVGAFLAVYKARLNRLSLAAAASGTRPARSGLLQLLAQLFTLGFLTVAALASLPLFIGGAIGLLLLPLFICINAGTEHFGLTHNAWGEAPAGGKGG